MGGGTGGGGGTGDRSPQTFKRLTLSMGGAWKESTSNGPRPSNRRAVAPPLKIAMLQVCYHHHHHHLLCIAKATTVHNITINR